MKAFLTFSGPVCGAPSAPRPACEAAKRHDNNETSRTTMSPTVSIVIGAYNAQRYLAQTLDSLLAQTLRDFELIVVDDGSQDATWDILKEYEAKDSRVRPLRIPHGGIVDAANEGMNAARAEYIAR